MTTIWPLGHVKVERGVTVNDTFVRPFLTGKVSVWLMIASCLFAACGLPVDFV